MSYYKTTGWLRLLAFFLVLGLVLFSIFGCDAIVTHPTPDIGGQIDLDPDDMDNPIQCLPDTAVCTQSSECCSGSCVFTLGNYPRCGNSIREQHLPVGWYERGCQWDGCQPPPGPSPVPFDPLFPLR